MFRLALNARLSATIAVRGGMVSSSSAVATSCIGMRHNSTAAGAGSSSTTTATPNSSIPTAAKGVDPDYLLNADQSRVLHAGADMRNSAVREQQRKQRDVNRSGSVARTMNDDGTVTGLKSLKQGWALFASVAFVIIAYLAVTKTEEANMARRHESIEKDIERERWRAKELGLASRDDGFADTYMTSLGKSDGIYQPPAPRKA